MAHALLSPSSASRWLVCTPSARLEAKRPDTESEAAKEGTVAHSLGELLIRRHLKEVSEQKFKVEFKAIQKILNKDGEPYYSPSMLEYCEDYATYVLERFAEAKKHTSDAKLYLERKLDLTKYIPEGFGTGDAAIVSDHTLYVIDLKYGKGVKVDAEDNKQMKVYALGWLEEFDEMYDIKEISMTIFQPRIDNISTWVISREELLAWGYNELKPKAKIAFEGTGEKLAGKHCQFCRIRATCKTNANMHLQAKKYDFRDPDRLSDKEISEILDIESSLKSWLTAVKEHALYEATTNGKKWPGYKLVKGRSNRKIVDPDKLAKALNKAGFKDSVIYKQKELISLTELESEVGKKEFEVLAEGCIEKPEGKPTLADITDKRPEINNLQKAIDEFDDGFDATQYL